MISSEERKQIVAYLYRLIKESPLFTSYTDDRIKEAAVKAEHKAYSSTNTKEEYLNAMNKKIERIKKAKAGENESLQHSTYSGTDTKSSIRRETNQYNRYYENENLKTRVRKQQQVEQTPPYNLKPTNDPNLLFTTQPMGRSQPSFLEHQNISEPHQKILNKGDSLYSQGFNSLRRQSPEDFGLYSSRQDNVGFNDRSQPIKGLYEQPKRMFSEDSSLYSSLSGSNTDSQRMVEGRAKNLTGYTKNNAYIGFDGCGKTELPIGKDLFVSNNRYTRDPGINLNNQQPSMSPNYNNNFDTFAYVNELNNTKDGRYNENKSFGDPLYSQRGYKQNNLIGQDLYSQSRMGVHQPSGYITERGFHSNQNLFEYPNYQEPPQFTQSKILTKGRGVVQPNSHKYRHRVGNEADNNLSPSVEQYSFYPSTGQKIPSQHSLYNKRDIGQLGSGLYMNGHTQRYPHTSPIGVIPVKKTERSFSNGNQTSIPVDRGINSTIGKELKGNPAYSQTFVNGASSHNKYNQYSTHQTPPSNYRESKNRTMRSTKTTTKGNLRLESVTSPFREETPLNPPKNNEIDEHQANELFNSVGSLFKHSSSGEKNNEIDFFDTGDTFNRKVNKETKIKKDKLDLTVPLQSTLEKVQRQIEKESPLLSPKTPTVLSKSNDIFDEGPTKRIRKENFNNEKQPVNEIKHKVVTPKTPQVNIPGELKEFMEKNNLNIIETAETNVQLLKSSLSRCEETQQKASKIYIEHQKEFPTSRIHQTYCKTNSLLEKQKEALEHNVYFLTWRCVDDLLDRLKSVYVDMKVELENSQKKTINYTEAINNALNTFKSAKKRDEDFVLDLREN